MRAFVHGTLDRRRPGGRLPGLQLDLNRATIGELALLPGIGRERAAAIVLHRVRHGPFLTPADLDAVDGIGPETVARLQPLLRIEPRPP